MRKLLVFALFSSCVSFAQTADIAGVWQADLQRSKIAGPPLKSYLAIITQEDAVFNRRTNEKAPQITDLSGLVGPHGEERETLKFFENDKPSMGFVEGIPARLVGSATSDTLTVTGEIAGRPDKFTRTYTLSSDRQTLTLHIAGTAGGHPYDSTYVLVKQPESAGDPLRKPQELAGEHFKNVKTNALKSLPTSEFIDNMRYFAWALGKDCQFCHVEHHFDSDDKKPKQTARKMIEMTASVDQNHFEGHPVIRCFTCHQGNEHPHAFPPFPDQAAELQHAAPGAHQ